MTGSAPSLYYLNNFNDFGASLITLFHMMVVNNWFVTVNLYTSIYGGDTVTHTFFILFYVFSVIVLMNIVIAFALEMYSSVENIV